MAPLKEFLADSTVYYLNRPQGYSALSANISRKLEYSEESLAGIAFSLPCVSSDFDKNNSVPPRFYSIKNVVTVERVETFIASVGSGVFLSCVGLHYVILAVGTTKLHLVSYQIMN